MPNRYGLEKKKMEEFGSADGEKIAAHRDMDTVSQCAAAIPPITVKTLAKTESVLVFNMLHM